MKSLKASLLGTLASFAILAAAPADAGIILKYSVNGGAFVTVTDGQAGADFNPGAGSITTFVAGMIGPKLVFEQVSGTQTMAPTQLHLSLQGSAAAGTIGTLEVLLTGTDYDAGDISPYTLGANVTSTSLPSNTTLAYTAWVDDNNAAFGTTTQIANVALNSQIISPNVGMGGNEIEALLEHAFSLTERFFFTFANSGARDTQVQGTITVEAIPEPATLALLGMGLVGLGLRRRFRKA